MSVSLFNISSLIGLPCTREEIFALRTMSPGVDYDHKDLKPSYPAFLRSACDYSQDLLTYGLMFRDAAENKKNFEECFRFFASLPLDRPDADFVVFLKQISWLFLVQG
ncbi:hypothetical protein SLEP1_g54042 [Rubroshorea leprosula]|uniref:Uncharacterized protein n=1 Tax=Rubroshorea leprosula TaxID=152421 RepID=A0AAV5ME31_9ROSI|nr:hypothetical protein SLEP1_g54042 [Rubroshorea leprosula]